ncbi:MAG: hypothetical protein F6K42_14045 [Leptolyngbya sp. SIO1D8]|nr:hypothetical protein [Leptolyngbya sp. SIO1D8]
MSEPIQVLQNLASSLPNQVTVKAALPNLSAGGVGVGDPSYFDLEITDPTGVLQGDFDGFCIDTDNDLGFNGFDLDNDGIYNEKKIPVPGLGGKFNEGERTPFSATVYSSYDPFATSGLGGLIEQPENLDLINWIINHQDTALSAYTIGEIQLAIWQLIDDAPPNDDAITGLQTFFNGFDQANVDAIKALAQTNGEGFVPEGGQKVAVILVPDGNAAGGPSDTDLDGQPDGIPDGQIIIAAVELPKHPGINVEKFVNGHDVADPTNIDNLPKIAAGDDVTFTYAVTNTGNVGFQGSEVIITDDNGTPDDLSDDLAITYVGGDLNNDNILDTNETWLYVSETVAAEDLTTTTASEDIRFHFTGHSYTNGPKGNVRTFVQDGVSVDVSAFSSNKYGGNWNKAYLGVYGGGLGVTNQYESGYYHRADNQGSLDYLLFEFDQDVAVDKAFLDYVGHDSDISIWIGDRNGVDISHLDGQLLDSFVKENNFTQSSYSRWADFNTGELVGDTVIISAYTNGSNDSFKLKKLDITVPGETEIGTYSNTVTVTAGDVSDSDMSGYINPAPVDPPQHFLYEAEDMHLCHYKVEYVGDQTASGGKVIKLSSYDGYASVNFNGPTGKYDILVGYYDENDGQSMAKVKVGGDVVDSWTFDELLGSNVASSSNFVERKIEDVHIEAGEQIKLAGWMNGYEFARFDYIKVVEVVDEGSLGSGNDQGSASGLEGSDLFAYLNANAPDLVNSGTLTDALV